MNINSMMATGGAAIKPSGWIGRALDLFKKPSKTRIIMLEDPETYENKMLKMLDPPDMTNDAKINVKLSKDPTNGLVTQPGRLHTTLAITHDLGNCRRF